MKALNVYSAFVSSGRWLLIPFLLSAAWLRAIPRSAGDQVGLFSMEVSAPNPITLKFDFKVRNMSGILAPGVSAPFFGTTASVSIVQPTFTIPSSKPELNAAFVVPESFGALFAQPQTVAAGDLDHLIMTQTSVNPAHITDLLGQLNQDIATRNLLLNQFSDQAKAAMRTIVLSYSPIPLDWESVLTKLLSIWVPGAEPTMTLIDLGVTAQAMQTTLQSLQVLQPQIDQLAETTTMKALDVWLPYGDAHLAGSIPDNPDPGIISFLPIGPKGSVPDPSTSTILVVPDGLSTAWALAGTGLLLVAGRLLRLRHRH